jgi:hypothetical protein
MTQEKKYYIKGSHDPRPESARTVYVDGASGDNFREGIDVELSHWRPNRTEKKYRAGTSTEICFKYLHDSKACDYDLVVNNHLDVDGVLSVFVLTHPILALSHEAVLIKAAEAGDFWAWGEGKAFKLFQLMSILFEHLENSNIPIEEAYERSFSLLLRVLADQNDQLGAETIIREQYTLVEHNKIIRQELNSRLVSYHVPYTTIQGELERYLRLPHFSEPISDKLAFWPQVRNRLDAQKMHLVSFETPQGIHYELWAPGYSWADTEGLWQIPGVTMAQHIGGPNTLQWEKLSKIVEGLRAHESGSCSWNLFPGFNFGQTMNPRAFPIIMSTVDMKDLNKTSLIPVESVQEVFQVLVDS